MLSILLFGLLAGLRHALEADHLAAVASLATSNEGPAASLRRGAAWGLGHSVILLGVAGAYWWAGIRVPVEVARWAEGAVGLMLILLGLDVLRRMRRGRIHLHVHHHERGVTHVHAHRHEDGKPHGTDPHDHAHRAPMSARVFAIGMVHGFAGSGALVLLAVQAVASPWAGLLYVALFGVGSIAGMMAASMAFVIPMRRSAALVNRALPLYELSVGVVAVAVGFWVLYASRLHQ